MKKDVYYFIFSIQNKSEDYARVSLFLSKLENKQNLNEDDIKGIKYIRLIQSSVENIKNIIDYINIQNAINITDLNSFNKLIFNLDYVIIININFTNYSDIIEFRNLMLIKNFYNHIKIIAQIFGNKNNYFKISHYLMLYSLNDIFYNSIYYNCDNETKKLQKRNIGILTDFLPLIQIHDQSEFLNIYFESTSIKDKLVLEQRIIEESCGRLINNFFKKIYKQIGDITLEEIVDIYKDAPIFEKCLFCFSLSTEINFLNKKDFLVSIKKHFLTIKQYASCVKQIVENVLIHSAINQGTLSIRVFDKKNHGLYIESKYGSEYFSGKQSKYFEITISDYSGNKCNGNIPEHFISLLPKEYKNAFNRLSLKDFFDTNNTSYKKVWERYYLDDLNLGRHYGLKIFNSLINEAQGVFLVESHSTHIPKVQDYFYSYDNFDNNETLVIPGTSYSVLLPMREFVNEDQAYSDVSITSDTYIQWNEYLDYYSREIKLFNDIDMYRNSKEKMVLISKIYDLLRDEIQKSNKRTIIQINANARDSYHAEIVCKAIVLLSSFEGKEGIPHIAFYNCSDVFINVFISTIKVFWSRVSNYNAIASNFQVALMPMAKSVYTVIVPASASLTAQINRYICMSRAANEEYLNDLNKEYSNEWFNGVKIVPFEVLVKPSDESGLTLFEIYARDILKNNVQEHPLGCKIEDTHMRLGSSIHIDDFYEAELLFGNKLFVSCFAFLLTKDIIKMNINNDIVLYGYASYSEMLLYNTRLLIKNFLKNKEIIVESMLLDREADNRGIGQVDLLRKSNDNIFKNKSTVIFIVPINSTMKTLGKMRDKIVDKFPIDSKDFTAFTLITIAPQKENMYWKFEEGRIIIPKNHLADSFCRISYYITAETNYHDAVKCDLCYPKNPIHEKPLIEVNASSTIPNQSFQLITKSTQIGDFRKEFKEQLAFLYDLNKVLLYGHTYRGENHFLYYIKTEQMFKEYNIKIKDWIERDVVTSKCFEKKGNVFNIIFCPMHSSNIDFVEMINDIVFHGAAMVIRVDVDKEYRSNFKAKFSNISKLIENLQKSDDEYSVRIHYVDDTIVTGRTYHRSKSIIKSLFASKESSTKLGIFNNVIVFYSVIILLNRNSSDSLLDYEDHFSDKEKTNIFKFMDLRIPSIRTHGDSCILCNLKRDASILCEGASTQKMNEYWMQKYEKSFEEKKVKDFSNNTETKPILRLLCSHFAGKYLPIMGAYNSRQLAMSAIIRLITTHLSINEELNDNIKMDSKEIFYSYIKVISRPFLSFDKFVKEAIFDLLLILIEALLDSNKNPVNTYMDSMSNEDDNKYIKIYDLSVGEDIDNMLNKARVNLGAYNENLLKILMKQLTELKSNYVIRVKCMNKIINYVDNGQNDNGIITNSKLSFIDFYAQMVKRLVSTGSDTSKSVWLDYILLNGHEPEQKEQFLSIPMMKKLVEILMVENTRVYYDAVEHLSRIDDLSFDYGKFQNSTKELYLRINDFLASNPTEEEQRNFYDMLIGNSLVKGIVDSIEILKSKKCIDTLEYLRKRFRETYVDGGLNGSKDYDKDSEIIINHINSGDYIYENFRKVLKNLCKFSNTSEDNTDCRKPLNENKSLMNMIVASVHLLRYINHLNSDSNNLIDRYRKLVIIIRELLDAYNVSIIIQNDVSINSWVEMLNNIANERGISLDGVIPVQDTEYEYIILSSSNTLTNEDEEYCPQNIANNIKAHIEDNGSEFYIGEKLFIWKIDLNSKHPIFIYADYYNEHTNSIVNAKCLMMMRHVLRKTVFGTNENDYIHELVQERNELAIQRRNKSHTHTNNSAQRDYYIKSLNGNSNSEKLGIIMILLADLAVSETYRQSLTGEFYLYNIDFFYPLWKDSLFKQIDEFVYSDNKKVKVITNGHLPKWHREFFSNDKFLDDEDILITLCTPSNEQKPLYFLLAMAQNALKVSSGEKNEQASVYITKTEDNNIRICNTLDKSVVVAHKEKIMKSILTPPITRDQGITMWSVSRYIRALSILAAKKYIEKIDPKKFDSNLIKKLFSEEFQILVKENQNESISCLSIEVQFLKEKFKQFLSDK